MHADALPALVKRDDSRPILVGFSGGLDSTVLLYLLAHDAAARGNGLRALHVHHGLHADADAWATHCQRVCAGLALPLQVVHADVDLASGLGIEGAARAARQRAFADALAPGETLALAHHRDDQAETFLLRALRGSGPDGLAAMRPWRAYARGTLWRPLLEAPRAALLELAQAHALEWIEDPANAAHDFDRNFLRHRVLPLLAGRWPHAADSLARCAVLEAEAVDLLALEDAAALASVTGGDATLDVAELQGLPRSRRARVLRRWIETLGLPPLPASGIEAIESGLLAARPDAEARFDWAGARVQHWRGRLHAMAIGTPWPEDWSQPWDGALPLALPTGDTLDLLGAARFDAPLHVHARHGGERITLPGREHTHALKHVLQDAGVPPWVRERLPLLSSADGELLAAGDRLLSARMQAWLHGHGARLEWAPVA